MKTATEQLIELAERLNPTGVIGDCMVAEFHALAARVRVELGDYVHEAECVACRAGMNLPPMPVSFVAHAGLDT